MNGPLKVHRDKKDDLALSSARRRSSDPAEFVLLSSSAEANCDGMTFSTTATATSTPTSTSTPMSTYTPTPYTPGPTPVFANVAFTYDGDGKRVQSVIQTNYTSTEKYSVAVGRRRSLSVNAPPWYGRSSEKWTTNADIIFVQAVIKDNRQ